MAATTTERRGEARPGTGKSVRSIPRLSTASLVGHSRCEKEVQLAGDGTHAHANEPIL